MAAGCKQRTHTEHDQHSTDSAQRHWTATCRRAGIRDLHVHDLRREFATRLLEAGVSIAEISLWLGHASIKMPQRYLKLTDVGLQGSLDKLEAATGVFRTGFAQDVENATMVEADSATEKANKSLVQ